ncbi:MAG: thiamine diphosphokinase [Mitsuokella sp.]
MQKKTAPAASDAFDAPDISAFQEACLLVSGGRAPAGSWLQEMAAGRDVWAVDHGLDACRKAGILPDRLIGDGDSAKPASWQWAKEQNVPIAKFPVEKDDTDTQLALKMAKGAGFPAAIVTGAFGGRFDHALSTMMSCAFAPLPCLVSDERETLVFVRGGETLQVTPKIAPKAISLLPFTAVCEGVTLQGTHWPLKNAVLTQKSMRAVSNVLEKGHDSLTISLEDGLLGLCFVWKE